MMNEDELAILQKISDSLANLQTQLHQNENGKGVGFRLLWAVMAGGCLVSSAVAGQLYLNMKGVDEWQTVQIMRMDEKLNDVKQHLAVAISERTQIQQMHREWLEQLSKRIDLLEHRK